MSRVLLVLPVLGFGFWGGTVFGCRYSVRDVGFVYFGAAPYKLYGYVGPDTVQGIRDSFEQLAYAALLDSSIELEIINVEEQKDHSALNYLKPGENISQLRAILVSRQMEDQPPEPLEVFTGRGDESTFRDALWSALNEVVDSPKRREIARQSVEAFGVLVLIEGVEHSANDKAQAALSQAIKDITKVMPFMPKPIEKPPQLLALKRELFEQEKVLLWSFGLDKQALNQPHVVILYGKGRRMGPMLAGDEISAERLYFLLSMIGADCECDLDRNWMLGPVMPLRWEEEELAQMVRLLGFDPENPLVKSEVSFIISQGGLELGRMGGVLDPLMGYQEIMVDFDDDPNNPGLAIGGGQISFEPERDQMQTTFAAEPKSEPVTGESERNTGRTPGLVEEGGELGVSEILSTSLYVTGVMSVLILGAGLIILRRARRRKL